MTISIYYDGDCPFCAKYVTLMRLKETVGVVELVDLRENKNSRYELISEGYNLDKGFVVEMNGNRVGGADAMNQLALLSTPSDAFNRLNKTLFSMGPIASLLYPFLRAGRWIVLFLLGRDQIGTDGKGSTSRAAIFGSLFALFSVFHFLNYALEYGRFGDIQIDLLFVVFSAISNHTIVRNFVVLGYWISFIYAMLRGLKWSDIFTNFTTAGQACLLIMYFFGVFHKINADFLNPETSCATALWREMPWPLHLIDHHIMHYLAIYGTFVVEGVLVLMLFSRRFRHIAVVFGILFHLMLGLSNYAMYISFTTLAIALHCLFLNEESARNIQNSKLMIAIKTRVQNPVYFAAAIILGFCFVIIRHGASKMVLLHSANKRPAHIIGLCLGLAFFMNCWSPYLGLKSAQAVNMFANIRLEAGASNHLIMRSAPKPFKYLEDMAVISASEGDGDLKYYEKRKLGIVYYELLAQLDDNPKARVSFMRKGQQYTDVSAIDLADDIDAILHPKWFRKWFHFTPANLDRPKYCTN